MHKIKHFPTKQSFNNQSHISFKSFSLNHQPYLSFIQVAIPALHISLGSYLKFFKMMQFRCHLLDVKMAGELGMQNKTLNREEFDKFVASQSNIKLLEQQVADIAETIERMNCAYHKLLLENPEKEEEVTRVFDPRFKHFFQRLQEKVLTYIF